MARNRAQFQSLRKALKSLNVATNTFDKAKGKVVTKFKIDVKTSTIDKVLGMTEKFPDAARVAFKKTLEVLANDLLATLDENMEAAAWNWNGDTRDIIDTGALRDSGKVFVDGEDIVITYSEDYAAIVHFGGYIRSGFNPEIQIYYPPRPWVTATLTGDGPVPGFDFDGELRRNFFMFLGQSALKELL